MTDNEEIDIEEPEAPGTVQQTTPFNPVGLALGIALGLSLGVALENLAIGMAIGLGLGVLFAVSIGNPSE
jgi:hypothetical protein